MMRMTVRVVRVDHYGFNGRECPPTDAMIGHTAQITKVETWCEDEPEELDLANESQNHGDAPWTVFIGVMDDGRRVELLDHEIELVEFKLGECI